MSKWDYIGLVGYALFIVGIGLLSVPVALIVCGLTMSLFAFLQDYANVILKSRASDSGSDRTEGGE